MAQQGFVYEENAAKALKKLGLVPYDFHPAGAGHDKPDLMLIHKGIERGCELKITDASAGSLVLKYDNSKKKWGFGKIKDDEIEKQFIAGVAEEIGIWKLIDAAWAEVPSKYEPKDTQWTKTFGKMSPKERYERDIKLFKDIKGEIPASKIEDYYVSKKTYYVNIGTHGFYLMGNTNPYKLTGVPKFSSSASATFRARVQYKGGGNHQFTFEMQFKMKQKSPYNIAPIVRKGSVEIDENKLNISCFK